MPFDAKPKMREPERPTVAEPDDEPPKLEPWMLDEPPAGYPPAAEPRNETKQLLVAAAILVGGLTGLYFGAKALDSWWKRRRARKAAERAKPTLDPFDRTQRWSDRDQRGTDTREAPAGPADRRTGVLVSLNRSASSRPVARPSSPQPAASVTRLPSPRPMPSSPSPSSETIMLTREHARWSPVSASTLLPIADDEPSPSEAPREPEAPAGGPVVVTENRRRRYRVGPTSVIELRPPTLPERALWQPSRDNVSVALLGEDQGTVRLALCGSAGPVKLALLDEGSARVVASWKFDLQDVA